jgi:hypothetical protein
MTIIHNSRKQKNNKNNNKKLLATNNDSMIKCDEQKQKKQKASTNNNEPTEAKPQSREQNIAAILTSKGNCARCGYPSAYPVPGVVDTLVDYVVCKELECLQWNMAYVPSRNDFFDFVYVSFNVTSEEYEVECDELPSPALSKPASPSSRPASPSSSPV